MYTIRQTDQGNTEVVLTLTSSQVGEMKSCEDWEYLISSSPVVNLEEALWDAIEEVSGILCSGHDSLL